MEEKVPWWRWALEFALSGIRSGFGLFRRNGRVETGAQSGAESEIAEAEFVFGGLEEPEEETALTQTSPQSGDAIADVRQAAEAVPSAEEEPVAEPTEKDQPGPAGELLAVGAVAAEVQRQALPEEAAAVEAEEPSAITETVAESASSTAGAIPVEEPTATSIVSADATPAAAPESPTAPAAAPASPQEARSALPFAAKSAAEPTTAEKVAAALKARGENADQSPFSVVVSQVYDGPLDLLLDLIRKQDIDIYDIPIAKITAQFLAYVDQLRASDMDVAGEFIYTASLLIHIKSKMLLPRAPAGPEEAAEDPRRDLVERLLEHERFRNAAQMLHEKQMLEAATWTNPGVREFREDAGEESEMAPEIAADTTDLVRVFSDILERARNRPILDVEEDTVTVSQMIQFLARRLTMEDKPVALRRLLSHTRSERALIAMFLALLELVRLQAILLRQDRQFSEVFIKKNSGFEAAMNQGLVDARDDWR
ncbi:MAG: segregation/condensation protein A [Terracidiphilus sp.]